MDTLLLDPSTWDLLIDSAGNIAKASNPYAIAQDVASAIKLFEGELFFDNTKGVQYFEEIFKKPNPENTLVLQIEAAAKTVPEVTDARCTSLYYDRVARTITGTVEVIDVNGAAQNVSF